MKQKRLLLLIKYLIAACLCILPAFTMRRVQYSICALLELAVILIITEWILQVRKSIARVFNSISMFLLLGQMLVLFFGRSFTSMTMLVNLDSLEALSGKLPIYFSFLLLAVVSAFIPHSSIEIEKLKQLMWHSKLVFCLCFAPVIILLGPEFSPCCNTLDILKHSITMVGTKKQVKRLNGSDYEELFYKDGIADGIRKPNCLPDNPDIIVLFVEGLSKNVIEDDRMLMPNLKRLEDKSISFSGYYNHTFLTYMGLIGQLYSGYQMYNFDENRLISIQSILSRNGYRTAFINTEPLNDEFTGYLNGLGFDEVITASDRVAADLMYISDKDAYTFLQEVYSELAENSQPFFLSMYSFGTHVSLNSPDEIFGDGSSNVLNKFYNVDVQLGKFIDWFQESDLTDHTLLVITGDHATYADDDFHAAFPDIERASTMLDTIPLIIYHKEITPQKIDANGRNSLDIAPTILDYLDISEENYFLGDSLFNQNSSNRYDTFFEIIDCVYSTANKEIKLPESQEMMDFNLLLQKYFSLKIGKKSGTIVSMNTSEDDRSVSISFSTDDPYDRIWFGIWGEPDGQNDFKWYEAKIDEGGTWQYVVPIVDHGESGLYWLHIYGAEKGVEPYGEFIISERFVADIPQ